MRRRVKSLEFQRHMVVLCRTGSSEGAGEPVSLVCTGFG